MSDNLHHSKKKKHNKEKDKQTLPNGIYTFLHSTEHKWCVSLCDEEKHLTWERNEHLETQKFYVFYDKYQKGYILISMNGNIVSDLSFSNNSNKMNDSNEMKQFKVWKFIKTEQGSYIIQLKSSETYLSFSKKRDGVFMTLKNENRDAVKVVFESSHEMNDTNEMNHLNQIFKVIEELTRIQHNTNQNEITKEFTFPNEITRISKIMIQLLRNYHHITIPLSVKTIDTDCFVSSNFSLNENQIKFKSIECDEQWINYFLKHSNINKIILIENKDDDGITPRTPHNEKQMILVEETKDNNLNMKMNKKITCHPKYFKYLKHIDVSEYIVSDNVTQLRYSHFSLGNKSISSIVLPKSIENIDEKTFNEFKNIKKVTCESKWINRFDASLLTHIILVEGTTFIRRDYFKNCTSLQTLEIPSSMQNIEPSSFSSCKRLSAIICDSKWLPFFGNIPIRYFTIQKNSGEIEKEHFMKSPQISQITIPYEIKFIQSMNRETFSLFQRLRKIICEPQFFKLFTEQNFSTVFDVSMINKWYSGTCKFGKASNCSFIIPEGVTEIKSDDICKNDMINDIQLPSTLVSIEENAFENLHNIKSVTLHPKWLKYFNKEQLNSITIIDGVEELQTIDFYGCSNVVQLNIPSSVKHIEDDVLKCCPFVDLMKMPSSIYKLFTVENIHISSTVRVIKEHMFSNWFGIQSICFDGDIESIPENAFENCTSLTSIEFTQSNTKLKQIKANAFKNCSRLTTIIFSNMINEMEIDISAFDGCSQLKTIECSVVLQTKLKMYFQKELIIDENEFIKKGEMYYTNYRRIETMTLPQNIKLNNPKDFFDSFPRLKWLICDPSLLIHFERKDQLEFFGIPEGIGEIKAKIFKGFKNIQTLHLCQSLEIIEKKTFDHLTNLTSVKCKINHLKYIQRKKLKTIIINDNKFHQKTNIFDDCINLEEIILPDQYAQVKDQIFQKCTKLKTIHYISGRNESFRLPLIIPSNSSNQVIRKRVVESIENVDELTIPDSVISIENGTFDNMTDITIYHGDP